MLWFTELLGLLAMLYGTASVTAGKPDRPHILLMLADDFG